MFKLMHFLSSFSPETSAI